MQGAAERFRSTVTVISSLTAKPTLTMKKEEQQYCGYCKCWHDTVALNSYRTNATTVTQLAGIYCVNSFIHAESFVSVLAVCLISLTSHTAMNRSTVYSFVFHFEVVGEAAQISPYFDKYWKDIIFSSLGNKELNCLLKVAGILNSQIFASQKATIF